MITPIRQVNRQQRHLLVSGYQESTTRHSRIAALWKGCDWDSNEQGRALVPMRAFVQPNVILLRVVGGTCASRAGPEFGSCMASLFCTVVGFLLWRCWPGWALTTWVSWSLNAMVYAKRMFSRKALTHSHRSNNKEKHSNWTDSGTVISS